MTTDPQHIGELFADWLRREGILESVEAQAIARAFAWQQDRDKSRAERSVKAIRDDPSDQVERSD